ILSEQRAPLMHLSLRRGCRARLFSPVGMRLLKLCMLREDLASETTGLRRVSIAAPQSAAM
ncbi:hypothetical protein, partial [Microbacterium sp. P5_E9]